jgi:hypothetical protein
MSDLMQLPAGFTWHGRQIVAQVEMKEGVLVPVVVVTLTPENWDLFHDLINSFLRMAIRHGQEMIERSRYSL